MKKIILTEFKPNYFGNRRNLTEPIITINSKSGQFSFNQIALAQLKVAPGAMVNFFQDEEGEWYIGEVAENGHILSKRNHAPKRAYFTDTPLATAMQEALALNTSFHAIIPQKPTIVGDKTVYLLTFN